MRTKINVYGPNLPQRTERKASILQQFAGKDLYDVHLIVPLKRPTPSTSLWHTFVDIVNKEAQTDADYFIFCEDDHMFTDCYSESLLTHCIEEAKSLGSDILSGGFSWYEMPIQVSENLFWVKNFTGMLFTVVYRKFFPTILESDVQGAHTLDLYLSTLSDDILVMSPYISVQKEFGYSDVTSKNSTAGRIDGLFRERNTTLNILRKVRNTFNNM